MNIRRRCVVCPAPAPPALTLSLSIYVRIVALFAWTHPPISSHCFTATLPYVVYSIISDNFTCYVPQNQNVLNFSGVS